MNDRLESALLLGSLEFYFLCGLICDSLLKLIKMLREFVELTAFIMIDHNG